MPRAIRIDIFSATLTGATANDVALTPAKIESVATVAETTRSAVAPAFPASSERHRRERHVHAGRLAPIEEHRRHLWGGDYEKANQVLLRRPFAKETGIGVSLVNNADLTKMKVQVDSKNVQWDVFDSVGPQITAGARQGMWEDIDAKIVDRSDLVRPAARTMSAPTCSGRGGL
jgi:hypothetical protein